MDESSLQVELSPDRVLIGGKRSQVGRFSRRFKDFHGGQVDSGLSDGASA